MSSNQEWPIAPPEIVQAPVRTKSDENPPWTGWDVTVIGLLMFVVPYFIIPVAALIAKALLYHGTSWLDVAKKPWIALSVQFSWYTLILVVYMIRFVQGTLHRSFWESIRWNWPQRTWPLLIPLGVAMVLLQYFERFFHLPAHVPIEEFLKTPAAAIMTGVLAVSFGPLMEELYFRGFLYPVVARRYGMMAAILVTSSLFGFIHAAQLAFAWGLVSIIFVVGLVLTIVRATLRSVGASFIVHVSYNSALFVFGAFAARHGDKIVQ